MSHPEAASPGTHGSVTRAVNAPGWSDVPLGVQRRIFEEVRHIAIPLVRKGPMPDGRPLDVTLAIDEAWIKLNRTRQWTSRAHFFSAAANAIRQILVQEARYMLAAKRNGPMAPGVPVDALPGPGWARQTLEADEELRQLEMAHPRAAAAVQLVRFAGASAKQIAEALDISERTAQRELVFAAAWLGARVGR